MATTGTGSGLAPFYNIPNEILVEIFLMHALPYLQYSCQWTSLMLVCRHWHDVVIATPGLWQAVHVARTTEWLELAIDRSRDAPLELRFSFPEVALDTIPLILSHAYRLRKLILPAMTRRDLLALQPLFRTTMPILNEIRFNLEPRSEDQSTTAMQISVDSVETHFPSLHSIRLENMAVDWTLPGLARMRYLTLRDCTALNGDLTFNQFLDVLEGCNELEDLRLHGFVSTIVHRVPAGFARTVVLPRLRRMTLSEPPALCRQILSAIHLPPTIVLRVFGKMSPNIQPNNTHDMFTSMLPGNSRRLLALIRTLKYADVYVDYRDITIELWSDFRDSRRGSSLMLRLQWESFQHLDGAAAPVFDDFIHLFAAHAPLEDVLFSYMPHSVHATAPWDRLFAGLPATVHTLTISHDGMVRAVWDALAGRHLPQVQVNANAARAARSALLPGLQTLNMDFLSWDKDAFGYTLEGLRGREMRGLPKLDMLSMKFMESDDTVEEPRERVSSMIRQALPVYRASVEEFASIFESGCM